MKRSTIITMVSLCLMVGLGMFVYILSVPAEERGDDIVSSSDAGVEDIPIEITVAQDKVVSLFAVGDNLIHDVIYKQASVRAGGDGYDFTYAYEMVEEVIPQDGIRFVNQETPLATALYPPSNYPLFNSPTEVGDHLVNLGFDVVNHANNHMLDKWDDGLRATMDYWDTQESINVVGVYDGKESIEPTVIDYEGIEIGFLGITDHTNGLYSDESGLGYILSSDREEIATQIEKLKESSDFIIVSAHWGDENVFEVPEGVADTAQYLADLGVDLVLGHHSHTVQPVKWLTGAEGNETLVVYSMGNFISAMADWYNMLGAAFTCDIVEDGTTGEIYITKPNMLPLVTYYEGGYSNLRVMTLDQYTEEMASSHGIYAQRNYLTPEYLRETFENTISEEFRD